MKTAYQIIMEDRKKLVDTLISNMEKGYIWSPSPWNSAALLPRNPVSGNQYHGGNRMRLMHAAIRNEYQDPRWITFHQAQENGWRIKKGSKGVLLEKWIFSVKKEIENENGEKEIIEEELDKPKVNYFYVFNGEQVEGLPEIQFDVNHKEDMELEKISEVLKKSSVCEIKESAADKACYIPSQDIIHLPLHAVFKSSESYLSVIAHEMSHSTGHVSRLNRPLTGFFGSKEYAREELRAEIGAAFLKSDLQVPLSPELLQDHSNYLNSWIEILKENPNEFFYACQDAEKISDFLYTNYEQTEKELQSQQTQIKNAAIESTLDYCDSEFHKETIDWDIQNSDGTFGKETNFYRIVIEKNESMIPLNGTVFSTYREALDAAAAMPDINIIRYDDLVYDIEKSRIAHQQSIAQELTENGFTPTLNLVENIRALHIALEKPMSLKEISEISKKTSRTIPDTSHCQHLIDKIAEECRVQEIAAVFQKNATLEPV